MRAALAHRASTTGRVMNEYNRATPSNMPGRTSLAGLMLLIALYLLPGVVGHDPWRGDDVRSFSAVLGMVRDGHWLLPHIAGEPAYDMAPLYHWVAAALVLAFGNALPAHDAARLATTLFAALLIAWTARSAARLYGREARTPAVLLSLGTLGLVLHAHETQPLMALVAMQALTIAGISHIGTQPVRGGMQAGAGSALAFLAAGPLGLLLTLPLFPLITIICGDCRTPRASSALILGMSAAIAASAIWPILLHVFHPELFADWWAHTWRAITGGLDAGDELSRLPALLGWFTWPLWPIAGWTLWRARKQALRIPFIVPLGSILLSIGGLLIYRDFSPAHALPLLPGLALLAAGGVPSLRRGAANAFDWFALMTFAVFAILVWLAWSAQVFQWPPGLARSLARSAPNFILPDGIARATVGALVIVAWLVALLKLRPGINRGPANWAMGMTMLWCLAVALLMPWFEHDRSYRAVSTSLQIALAGEAPGCVSSIGINTSHRASFDYYSSIRVRPVGKHQSDCRYLLVRTDQKPGRAQPTAGWQNIWEFRHGGTKRYETFRLYRRE